MMSLQAGNFLKIIFGIKVHNEKIEPYSVRLEEIQMWIFKDTNKNVLI